jgi:hypothetical protein
VTLDASRDAQPRAWSVPPGLRDAGVITEEDLAKVESRYLEDL